MATPVTPILIEAEDTEQLRRAGYETHISKTDMEALNIATDEPGEAEVAAWEPKRPEGDGWTLHYKGWNEFDPEQIIAIWARPRQAVAA